MAKYDFEALPKDEPGCLCRFTDMYGQKVKVMEEEGHDNLWFTTENEDGEESHIILNEQTVSDLWRMLKNWSVSHK